MSDTQLQHKLKFKAITAETEFENISEISILDDAGSGFTLVDSEENEIVFAGGITSLSIAGAGKTINYIKITPASGATINVMYY